MLGETVVADGIGQWMRRGYEHLVRVDQPVRPQVPLRHEPDLPLRVGQHHVAFAGFRRVVHPQNFVDQRWIEMRIVYRMRPGNEPALLRVNLDVQTFVDVHCH